MQSVWDTMPKMNTPWGIINPPYDLCISCIGSDRYQACSMCVFKTEIQKIAQKMHREMENAIEFRQGTEDSVG